MTLRTTRHHNDNKTRRHACACIILIVHPNNARPTAWHIVGCCCRRRRRRRVHAFGVRAPHSEAHAQCLLLAYACTNKRLTRAICMSAFSAELRMNGETLRGISIASHRKQIPHIEPGGFVGSLKVYYQNMAGNRGKPIPLPIDRSEKEGRANVKRAFQRVGKLLHSEMHACRNTT